MDLGGFVPKKVGPTAVSRIRATESPLEPRGCFGFGQNLRSIGSLNHWAPLKAAIAARLVPFSVVSREDPAPLLRFTNARDSLIVLHQRYNTGA